MKVSSLALGGNNSDELVTLVERALVLTEASAGHLDGTLLLDGDTGTDVLDHLALVGSEASDLGDNLADGGNSGVELSLAVGGVLLEGVVTNLGLGNDETVVEANE